MGDISVIEWAVYGFIAYSTLLMLIISIIKEVPTTKSLAITRTIFMIPGMICSGVLALSGVHIVFQTVNTTTRDLNSSTVWTEATTTVIPLQSDVWMIIHGMIFIILLFYSIVNVLDLMLKHS